MSNELGPLLVFSAVVIFASCAGRAGCSTSDTANARAAKTLELDGYTDVETTGFRFFSCGGDTLASTGFAATSPSGSPVTGAVCCGVAVRGCSIRTDLRAPGSDHRSSR